MLRFIVMAVVLIAFGAVSAAGQAEESYDEMSELPTINIIGCGVFPRVRVLVDGKEIESSGFIRQGRTYLPARELLEKIGSNVTWVKNENAFYAQFPGRQRTVRIATNSNIIRIFAYNGTARYGTGKEIAALKMDRLPIQCEGRVFAPIRAAVVAVGGKIDFDSKNRVVSVQMPKSAKSQ